MASDGKWYPPRWEHTYHWHYDADLDKAMAAAMRGADRLGTQGWELVSHTAQWTPVQGQAGGGTTVTCFFKRLLPL